MLTDFLWDTFESTGNIEAYLALKQITEKKTSDQEEIAEEIPIIK